MRKALVPGTFDPITNGHLDVIGRASQMFDEIVVGVANSAKKGPLFSIEERVAFAREATAGMDNVTVMPFNDLLVHFAEEINANVVVKGLRAITDFEYEFQMTAANYRLDSNIDDVHYVSSAVYVSLSSIVQDRHFKGEVGDLVPACVEQALRERFANN